MKPLLEINNLHAGVDGKEILHGISLSMNLGEIHAIMGPNGSGKSTLSAIIMGKSEYTVTKGDILFQGESILGMSPDERARKGVFLAFQYPVSIPGVSVGNFLRTAYNNVQKENPKLKELSVVEFSKLLKEKMQLLRMKDDFATRYLNDKFSGGEKKKAEMLQMAILQPSLAILDETDSGLDIDALRIVANSVNAMKNSEMSILIITHYQRLLTYITPDFVHVLADGKIIKSGDKQLALELEQKGYEWIYETIAK